MSRTTPHLCAHPGCNVILLNGPGRCPQHHGTPRSGTPGYGARWRRTRNAYIAEFPDCERCAAIGRRVPGLDVHHRDGLGPTGPRGYDWTNLETLCRSCHRRETEHTKRARRAA